MQERVCRRWTEEGRRTWKILRRHEISIAGENSRREPPRRKAGWLWSRRRGSGPRANVLVRYMQIPPAALPIEQRRLLVLRLAGISQTFLKLSAEHYSESPKA